MDGDPSNRRKPWTEMESELACGLRNNWYCLLPSDELGAGPKAIRRLGEDLVVWRDGSGTARVFQDRCPHRGAMLSRGRVIDGVLACAYHGWAFEGSGKCMGIPSEGGSCGLATEVSAGSYPTEEHGGLIFAYMSTDGRAPHVPCPNPPELESDAWNGFIIRHHWTDAPWFRVMENLVDPMHGPILHAGTYTLGRGELKGTIAVDDTEDGLFVHREDQALVSFDYATFHFPNWFVIDIPYPWTAGPGGPMRILIFVAPIDAGSSQVYMVRKREVTGWKWLLWRLLWRLRLERKMWQVIDDDEQIIESQRGTSGLEGEFLSQADLGIVRMRQMFVRSVAETNESRSDAAE